MTIDPEDHRGRPHRVPERVHLRGRRAPRRRRGRDGQDEDAREHRRAWSRRPGEAGVTIMHAPITFAEGYNEISAHPYGILKGVVDGKAFVKGTWGAAIVDDLAPADGRHRRSRASAASTPSRAPTSTSSCAARASRRSCSAASSPTAASSRRCAPATRTATGHHAHRLRRGDLDRGARQRDHVRLPDVLAAGPGVGAHRTRSASDARF